MQLVILFAMQKMDSCHQLDSAFADPFAESGTKRNSVTDSLHALRVPLVANLAGSGRAARRARVSAATALSPHGSAGRSGVAGLGLRGAAAAVAAVAAAAGPDRRAGDSELLEAVVDAEVGVGVAGLVGAGELDGGARGAAAAVHDLDLHARDVVLRLVDVGPVDT